MTCVHTGDSDEVGRSSVRGASVANNVSGKTTTDDEDGLLSDEAKVVHGVDKGLLQNDKDRKHDQHMFQRWTDQCG